MPIIIKPHEILTTITVDINLEILEKIRHYCEHDGIYDWGHFVEEAAVLFIAQNKENV